MFFLFYFFNPEKAEEKCRKYRAVATPTMMRLSWEKGITPILRFITSLDRGYLNIRKEVSIPRPKTPSQSSFRKDQLIDIKARLYFNGTTQKLKECRELIFQVPGGGFVSSSPKCHDEYVSEWARKTGLPIISVDYGKAPEYPYPFALEECLDAYKSIVESNGEVIGMCGWKGKSGKPKPPLKIVVVGDSA
jgi:acetyl esterase/lipase